MPVLGNFVLALSEVIHLLLNAYMWIVIIRAIVSWVNPDPYNPIVSFLYRVTEPVLRYVRRFLPPLGGIDFSPIIVLVAIVFIDRFFVPTLVDIGYSLTR